MGTCKLCLQEKPLKGSHVIPRAFMKRVKSGCNQLIRMVPESENKPRFDNANWNLPLLCGECERLINERYETSQIRYLRNGKITVRHPDRVTFGQFNFDKFYLFWLSILWRASVADMDEFASVELGAELNEIVRAVLMSGTTRYGNACMSDFIQIGIVRLKPSDGDFFCDETLRQVISNFVLDASDGLRYYFLVEGFLVAFELTVDVNLQLPKEFGRVKKTFNFRMPALKINESKWATSMFNKIIAHAKQNAGWRDR